MWSVQRRRACRFDSLFGERESAGPVAHRSRSMYAANREDSRRGWRGSSATFMVPVYRSKDWDSRPAVLKFWPAENLSRPKC